MAHLADFDVAAQEGTRCDVGPRADEGVVLDDGGGVDDGARADARAGLHDAGCEQLRSRLDRRERRHDGARVTHTGELPAGLRQAFLHAATQRLAAAPAHAPDAVGKLHVARGMGNERFVAAEHGQPRDVTAVARRVGVGEAEDAPPGGDQRIGHDEAVTSGADHDHGQCVHGWIGSSGA